MAEGFKTGDVVELKSGSPKMTVHFAEIDSFSGAFRVVCSWFVNGKKETDEFRPDMLKLSDG